MNMMLYDDVYVPNGNYFEKLLQLTQQLRLFFITFQKTLHHIPPLPLSGRS